MAKYAIHAISHRTQVNNRSISYCATKHQGNFYERQTDGRTDGRTDGHR